VCSFRCEGASPETPEIFPETPDFPEIPEKSPEYSGFTDKFVLSGDFQDSPIHPPSRKHQDPFTFLSFFLLFMALSFTLFFDFFTNSKHQTIYEGSGEKVNKSTAEEQKVVTSNAMNGINTK
jgi:hypothetical protein